MTCSFALGNKFRSRLSERDKDKNLFDRDPHVNRNQACFMLANVLLPPPLNKTLIISSLKSGEFLGFGSVTGAGLSLWRHGQ